MFKIIFRHRQYQIAITIFAESLKDAKEQLMTRWKELAESGVDIPHPTTFEAAEQIIL
jgi:hypothetical protein